MTLLIRNNLINSYMLPIEFKKYFWDCDFKSLNWESYKFFITERILNYGDMSTVKWLRSKLTKEEILEYIRKSKNIDSKTRNFWEVLAKNA